MANEVSASFSFYRMNREEEINGAGAKYDLFITKLEEELSKVKFSVDLDMTEDSQMIVKSVKFDFGNKFDYAPQEVQELQKAATEVFKCLIALQIARRNLKPKNFSKEKNCENVTGAKDNAKVQPLPEKVDTSRDLLLEKTEKKLLEKAMAKKKSWKDAMQEMLAKETEMKRRAKEKAAKVRAAVDQAHEKNATRIEGDPGNSIACNHQSKKEPKEKENIDDATSGTMNAIYLEALKTHNKNENRQEHSEKKLIRKTQTLLKDIQ